MSTKIFVHTPQLARYTSLGRNSLAYFDHTEHGMLCCECATEEKHDGHNIEAFIHYEGPSIFCENCNTEIESSYGDPDAEDTNK